MASVAASLLPFSHKIKVQEFTAHRCKKASFYVDVHSKVAVVLFMCVCVCASVRACVCVMVAFLVYTCIIHVYVCMYVCVNQSEWAPVVHVCNCKRLLFSVYKKMEDAMKKHPDADNLVSFASLRSAYESTMEAMTFPQV